MGSLTTRIRWGILGTGRMAGQFARDLRRLSDAQLVAVGSRDASRASAFARAFGALRAHAGYAGVVADSGVDVVYVATPNSEHREHCMLALAAGKPVLCEKPFATNGREAREVVALARERRLFCMEAMWTRCLPLVVRAEALVRAGEIGEPVAVHADFGVLASRESSVFRPELGGGALLDLGVYLLAMARAFLGPVVEVNGRALRGPTGVDEQSSMLLGHAGGGHSLLLASLLGEIPAAAVVLGTRGRLRIHPPFYRAHRISVDRFADVVGETTKDSVPASMAPPAWKTRLRPWYHRFEGLLSGLVHRPALTLFEPVDGHGYHHEAAEVMRCLRSGALESPRMPLDETVAVVDLMDRLRS